MDSRGLILIAALALDWLFGDPPWLWRRVPHPVVLAGAVIARLEAALNRSRDADATRRRKGAVAVFALVLAAILSGILLSWLLGWLPFGAVLEVLIVTVLLAGGSLDLHVRRVAEALETSGIEAAREAVSHIVGRDTSGLDRAAVSRATIESAAENFADGLVAPAFWYLVAGLPGILAYKAINTADSMIGYRSQRYRAFGLWAARIDDIANLIPARLGAGLIVLTCPFLGLDWRHSLTTMWRDASRHVSPNAGWPEAAMAGALDVALGGPRSYGGEAGHDAWLNDAAGRDAGAADIRRALAVTRAATGLHALALLLVVLAAP